MVCVILKWGDNMSKKVNNLVEKSNILNTLRCPDMSLTELRFFCLYLSKLNAREPENRTIIIPIEEFEEMFETKLNTTIFKQKIKRVLSQSAEIKTDGEVTEINLYSKFKWKEEDCKYVEVTCNYDVVPYLFELQKNYTTYMIGNIAKLTSVSKIRLYEIAKQYEKMSSIKLPLEELQEMMCSQVGTEFPFFNRDTLKPAIKDINRYTDVEISYDKVLSCRKVVALNLHIKSKVKKVIDSKFKKELIKSVTYVEEEYHGDYFEELRAKCSNAYTRNEIKQLYALAEQYGVTGNIGAYIVDLYLKIKKNNKSITNLYSYTLKSLENEVKF